MPQSRTLERDEIAHPTRRVEDIRPDQNPALDPSTANQACSSRRADLFIWLVSATNSEASESSKLRVATWFVVVDVSPGELYSVENPHPHQRYER